MVLKQRKSDLEQLKSILKAWGFVRSPEPERIETGSLEPENENIPGGRLGST